MICVRTKLIFVCVTATFINFVHSASLPNINTIKFGTRLQKRVRLGPADLLMQRWLSSYHPNAPDSIADEFAGETKENAEISDAETDADNFNLLMADDFTSSTTMRPRRTRQTLPTPSNIPASEMEENIRANITVEIMNLSTSTTSTKRPRRTRRPRPTASTDESSSIAALNDGEIAAESSGMASTTKRPRRTRRPRPTQPTEVIPVSEIIQEDSAHKEEEIEDELLESVAGSSTVPSAPTTTMKTTTTTTKRPRRTRRTRRPQNADNSLKDEESIGSTTTRRSRRTRTPRPNAQPSSTKAPVSSTLPEDDYYYDDELEISDSIDIIPPKTTSTTTTTTKRPRRTRTPRPANSNQLKMIPAYEDVEHASTENSNSDISENARVNDAIKPSTSILQTTTAPTTTAPTTNVPSTIAPTTNVPTTNVPSTNAPSTIALTTNAPSTIAPSTIAPSTNAPSTIASSTIAPTTIAPSTIAPSIIAPSTIAPSTIAPSTNAPSTAPQTTNASTKNAPTTNAPTTKAPTTNLPTTNLPTTAPQTTFAPSTSTIPSENVNTAIGNESSQLPLLNEIVKTIPSIEKRSDKDVPIAIDSPSEEITAYVTSTTAQSIWSSFPPEQQQTQAPNLIDKMQIDAYTVTVSVATSSPKAIESYDTAGNITMQKSEPVNDYTGVSSEPIATSTSGSEIFLP